MNKEDLVKIIQENSYFSYAKSCESVEGILDIMSEHLVKRGRIEFSGFGSFFVRVYKGKCRRNPKIETWTGYKKNLRVRISPRVLKNLNNINKEII